MRSQLLPHELRLFRIRDVVLKVGLSHTTIYKRVKQGTFPAPVRVGDNAVAWPSDEIDRWIGERLAASRPA
jgi:prophage regulatory protein